MRQTSGYAEYGLAAVRAGTPDFGNNDERTDAIDMLTNFMHYLDSKGMMFGDIAAGAHIHHSVERKLLGHELLKHDA